MTDVPERKRRDLCLGDNWRLELECKRPGESFLVLHIGGKQEGRIPVANVLQIHARFDEGAADAAQRLIEDLRQKAGDWESKYWDKVVDSIRLARLEGEVAQAKEGRADAESELARLRATPPPDPVVAANLTTLLAAATMMLARCPRCGGAALVQSMPCPYCGVFRELVHGIKGIQPRDPHRDAADLERGLAQLEGNRRELEYEQARAERAEDAKLKYERPVAARPPLDEAAVAEKFAQAAGTMEYVVTKYFGEREAFVFMLHPGVGTEPYWELANERDPEVIRLRAGKVPVGLPTSDYGKLPPAFMRGRFMALEPAVGGGDVWTEATEFVMVDRETGLAACPERLRQRYRALAEGRL